MIDLIPTADVMTVAPAPKGQRRTLFQPIPDLPEEYLLVLDNSAIETWMMCPTKAQFYLVDGCESPARNAALTYGSAVHLGLELMLKGEGDDAIAAAVKSYWDNNPTPPDEWRTLPNALTTLRYYREQSTLPDYQLTVLTDNRGPIVERAFELPLGVLDVDDTLTLPSGPLFVSRVHVAWSGRIDLVAHVHGMSRIVDHKTTSIAGDSFVQDFAIGSQPQGYVWAGRQLWPELNISGFCVDAIHGKKPAMGCGMLDRGPRGGAPALSLFRAYFEYSEARLTLWQDNALALVEDFVHCLIRDFFPMHTKQCFNKYGKCSYHDVCTLDNAVMRYNLLHSACYQQVTWNPTADR